MSDSSDGMVVLGTDPHVIQACADRGLGGIAVRDVNKHLRGDNLLPPGFREVVVGDLTNIGDVVAGLMRIGDGRPPEGLVGVVTMDEYAVATASCLGAVLGIRSLPVATAARMRDKYVQKRAVTAGARAARARVTVAGSRDFHADYPGPCVVKPLAGAGTSLTYKCRSEQEYAAALKACLKDAGEPLVVEDLIDVAEEWTVDGVVQNGAVAFASLGKYPEPLLDLIGSGSVGVGDRVLTTHRIDESEDPEACAQARAVTAAALSALGYTDGIFHLELLRERGTGEFWFGECAARRGGAMIEEEVRLKHGFSLAGAAIDALLGRDVSPAPHLDPRWIGTTYLHLPAGTILRVADPEDLLKLGFVHDVHISALVGPSSPPAHMHSAYRHGMCVVSGDSRRGMLENMAQARRAFQECSAVAPTNGTRAEIREFMARMRRS